MAVVVGCIWQVRVRWSFMAFVSSPNKQATDHIPEAKK